MGIADDLLADAKAAESGDFPEDGCRWAITMREAARRIAELEAALVSASAALTNAGSSLKIQADALKDAGFAAYKIRDV